MNLSFSIKEIQDITEGKFIGDFTFLGNGQINTIVIDSRSPHVNEETLFVVLKGTKTTGAEFVADFRQKKGKLILTEKPLESDILINQIVVNNALRALQKLAIAHRKKFNIPVIGITGSNGKTTVKEWLYHVLKKQFKIVRSPKSYNSQIGVALSVLELNETHTLGIFEAGISTTNEMQYLEEMIRPTLGVFTGIGDAHNNGFHGPNPEEEKKREKFKLFQNSEIVFRWENDYIMVASKKTTQTVYQLQSDAFSIQLLPENDTTKVVYKIQENAYASNIALIVLVAQHFNVDSALIQQQILSLPTISMRLEKLKGRKGNLLINDAYSIDKKSLEIGIQYLNANKEHDYTVLFIAEDRTKDNSVLPVLKRLLQKIKINEVVYIGNNIEPDKDNFIDHFYSSAADFLSNPIEYQNTSILFTGSRSVQLEQIVSFYLEQKHITRLEIDLGRVKENLNFYRSNVDKRVKILAMVKAQSYGGGILEMARFLTQQGVDYFGVAYADEGISLVNGGISKPIMVMNPEPASYDTIIEHQLEPSIYSLHHLNEFIHQLIVKGRSRFPIHVKIETGMNRLGFNQNQLDELLATLKSQPEVIVKSVFSHFSVADDPSEIDYTKQQIDRFIAATNHLEKELGYTFMRHLANSNGTLYFPDAHFDMVRLGIGMFGLIEKEVKKGRLQNALKLTSQLSQIRLVQPGESVGYGRKFKAKELTRVGIIPVGYGDGFRRSLGNGKWNVMIDGKAFPLIGNVCMDSIMVDLTGSEINVGDEAVLFGDENSVFEMSNVLDTIPYEIISTISTRVQRIYIEE